VFAVQVDTDVDLSAQLPVRLSMPVLAGINPNTAQFGSLSPIGMGDRLALAVGSMTGRTLLTFGVERDVNLKITGLTDLVVVGDLVSLVRTGRRSPTRVQVCRVRVARERGIFTP
jgi:hypothetical protein